MLSVRPHLAGAASGLGGSISIAGGAGLSTLAGLVLAPGSTEMPLLILMWASSLLGLITALLVQKLNKEFSLNA
jgi:DHA1 family bicyclomycin/chloramphenicol resistance-like MFS transporter